MSLSVFKSIDVPPVWLLLFALAVWFLGQSVPMPLGSGLLRGLGTVLVALGIGVIFAAAWQFRQHKTTIIPHQNASAMITTGLFGFSRNPIYLADAVILAGLCLRWDVVPGLILVPVFMALIQRRFILGEEARLRTMFGADFDAYAAKTRRWV